MKALTLAFNGKVTDCIVPSFKKMDSFLKEWNIGISDQRELFLTISNVLKENKRYGGKGFSHTKVKLVLHMHWTGSGVGFQVYY
jgi:translation initiation factor 3 subunit M